MNQYTMKKLFSIALLSLSCSGIAKAAVPAAPEGNLPADTVRVVDADQIVVLSSAKETNALWKMPAATSLMTPSKINDRRIASVVDISTYVPNLFIPDYGSAMTTPIYLRGVGARSSSQSVGMYVDNIPYMNKNTFDFEFSDVQYIEVLRGPQGTLYGRNAMGGIINVYTLSPLDYQGAKISVGAGNYGSYEAKGSYSFKVRENIGISASAYYDRTEGYFRNLTTGARADSSGAAGGRLKLEWQINPRLKASLTGTYDYTDQNAFPYGAYDKTTGAINAVAYNDRGTYLRNMSTNSLRFEYVTDKVMFTSNTGHQWLCDNMWMDQDFTPKSVFTINQRQKEIGVNQEFAVRSVGHKNYQWSAGAFGFYTNLKTHGDVTFKQDGIKDVLQPVFTELYENGTMPLLLKITDTEIPNPGFYVTPEAGAAIFHQSTFNNLFTDGLSLTLGLRVDYEKQWLDYNTSMTVNFDGYRPPVPRPIASMPVSSALEGSVSQDYWQWLPKVALEYQCSPGVMTYLTAAKGYRAGGYNIQMFSEVIQEQISGSRPGGGGASGPDINSTVAYKPEVTWNYEFGTRAELFDKTTKLEVALFYMDIRDVQLTQFVAGGSGRILTNAGKAYSYGADLTLSVRPVTGLTLDLNYGFNHAILRDYNTGEVDDQGNPVGDYSGNYIPYVPQNTLALGASYSLNLKGWLSQISVAAQYTAAGKIYWNEANDASQSFYGTVNGKLTLRHEFARLELWGRNLLNADYGAFYFKSFGNEFMQRGAPVTFGANLVFSF